MNWIAWTIMGSCVVAAVANAWSLWATLRLRKRLLTTAAEKPAPVRVNVDLQFDGDRIVPAVKKVERLKG